MPRPRWVLHIQAETWRHLMSIGMALHKLAPPRPPDPTFSRSIPTTLSTHHGKLVIQFYTPKEYDTRKKQGGKKFPVILNFHGGGFTLGRATDDARWASAVTTHSAAIVASVDYRRAPEFHFPTAVEDGVDALMYLFAHAEDLWIDTDRIAVSGFSSGGNMAFTVPLRLMEELNPDFERGNLERLGADALDGDDGKDELEQLEAAAAASAPGSEQRRKSMAQSKMEGTGQITKSKTGDATIVRELPSSMTQHHNSNHNGAKGIKLAAIIAWYPPTDYTRTRAQRRATNVRPDQELSAVFTTLFDASYLHPPTLDHGHPYLSPGVAPIDLLSGLPDDIIMYTVEYDMLRDEGERFKEKLERMGKRIRYKMVPGVPHGWDKAPNPFKPTPGAIEHYRDACAELNEVFERVGRT